MVKQSISLEEAIEKLSDIWAPLNEEQRNFLKEHLTIQTYKKNESIYSEGELPNQLLCLLQGKVKYIKTEQAEETKLSE